jgi:hypothetical protein
MALPTQGTAFTIKVGAGTATPIGQAVSWSGPRFDRNEIDTTHLASTAKEYLLGLKDPGEFTIDVNFDLSDPGQSLVWDQLDVTAPAHFTATFPSTPATGFTFDALVKGFESSGNADDKIDGTITLRITGPVVRT